MRCAVMLGFGLVHGLGFARALRESGLVGRGMELVAPLFGFNLGVECGQLAFAAFFLPLLFLARLAAHFQRHDSTTSSVCVGGLGGFWSVQRF